MSHKATRVEVDSDVTTTLALASEVVVNPEAATKVEREDEEEGGEESETIHSCFYVSDTEYDCTRRIVLHPSKAKRHDYWDDSQEFMVSQD